jgi:hypothetical protein
MVRTQIYLTESEKAGLKALSKATGKKQAELIREAVDRYIQHGNFKEILARAEGMWKNRTDLPDFAANRHSWDSG